MSCDGCLTSEKEIQRNLEQTFDNAKKYAKQHNKTLAIFQLPDKTHCFVEADRAPQGKFIKYVSVG